MRNRLTWAKENPIAAGALLLAYLMAKAIVDSALLAAVLWLAIQAGLL